MKIEVEDSVYEHMSTMMFEGYGLTLEEFLSRYLTHCVALAAVDPEKAIAIGTDVMAVEGMDAFWSRITRKPSDACG